MRLIPKKSSSRTHGLVFVLTWKGIQYSLLFN